MGTDASLSVDAPLVFMLAIKEKEKQVVMIQQLVELIQNPSLLTSLTAAKDASQALNLITASVARDP
jgi:PTS system galactitol-specific IIA component